MLNTCKLDGKWCFQWRTGRFDLAWFDSVRFGSSPTSRHSSVVRPRVRHAKHGEPRTNPADT
ncbi:hypothetical protein Hanom_Chr09g00778491 [Helianthus anomalus]